MKKLLSATALALTLVVSGAAYAHDYGQGKDGHKGMHQCMEEALAKLPKDDAAAFRDTMSKAHEKNKALFEQLHKLREEQQAILTAPDFDKSAWLSKGKEIREFRENMHKEMRENRHEAFAEALSSLSQEERQTLAAAMEKMRKEHHHWDHHGDHSKGKPVKHTSSGSAQQ